MFKAQKPFLLRLCLSLLCKKLLPGWAAKTGADLRCQNGGTHIHIASRHNFFATRDVLSCSPRLKQIKPELWLNHMLILFWWGWKFWPFLSALCAGQFGGNFCFWTVFVIERINTFTVAGALGMWTPKARPALSYRGSSSRLVISP